LYTDLFIVKSAVISKVTLKKHVKKNAEFGGVSDIKKGDDRHWAKISRSLRDVLRMRMI